MNQIKEIIKFIFDKDIPLKEKWSVILPLIYILSPIDLIPAPVIGFSLIDDLVMLVFLLSVINDKVNKYSYYDKHNNKKKKEDIIENVDYDIKDED